MNRSSGIHLHLLQVFVSPINRTVYFGAPFNRNVDDIIQNAFIMVFKGAIEKACLKGYEEHKSRSLARSSLSETNAKEAAFDCAYVQIRDLQFLLRKYIQLLMISDLKLLFDVMNSDNYCTKAFLMIKILIV